MISELQHKFILIDTCVISESFNYLDEENIKVFFKSLEELECKPCINDLIKLELLRVATSDRSKKAYEEHLNKRYQTLPVADQEIFTIATELYPLYNYCHSIRNNKQVSTVDAISVAFLRRYGKNLYFITFDNNDFPLELVDRVATGTIDVKERILTWGIYKFNEEKFQKLSELYKKSKN